MYICFFLHCSCFNEHIVHHYRHQGSKRAARPDGPARPGPAQRNYLVGPGGPIVMIAGPGGPSYLSGRPGPTFLSFFLLFTKLYACHKRQKLLKTFYDGKSTCISDTYKVINHSNCSNWTGNLVHMQWSVVYPLCILVCDCRWQNTYPKIDYRR
jgi:hypothetical protein